MDSTLELLSARHPSTFNLPILVAGRELGFSPQTTRNRVSLGTFPIQSFLIGSRRYVRIDDLARAIDEQSGRATALQQPSMDAPRRGPPSKVDYAAAEADGFGKNVKAHRAALRARKGGHQ
jgi:hypothetical protein